MWNIKTAFKSKYL